jgi:diaminopimelate epimerase
MGNPHAVIFLDDPSASLLELARTYGPTLEHDARFPRRTNVEFARVKTSGTGAPEIDLVVWERGCGITLACGTGACATVVAACVEDRLAANQEIPVHLPGGTLFIRVAQSSDGHPAYTGVQMRGPANSVFAASVDPTAIRRPPGR